jgi:hypothetical protein
VRSTPRYEFIDLPDRWLIVERDGVRTFVGYIAKLEPDGKGNVRVTARGPVGLLEILPLPYRPPMVEAARNRDAFEFWWKQLDFVFEFEDPGAFAPLPAPISSDEREIVNRYVATARDLAESSILNAIDAGISVRIDDHTDAETVIARFELREVQVGFAALLRHCDSENERAHFGRVLEILESAARDSGDPQAEARLVVLHTWREAVDQLHQKSAEQLVRDRLARDADAGVLDYDEPQTPKELIRTYDYGDLLHWGRERHTLEAWESDEFLANERRLAFLAAASGLAHAYIGFAELARAAVPGEQ